VLPAAIISTFLCLYQASLEAESLCSLVVCSSVRLSRVCICSSVMMEMNEWADIDASWQKWSMWQRMKQSSLGSNVKVTRVTRPKIDLEAWWRHHSRLLELSTVALGCCCLVFHYTVAACFAWLRMLLREPWKIVTCPERMCRLGTNGVSKIWGQPSDPGKCLLKLCLCVCVL